MISLPLLAIDTAAPRLQLALLRADNRVDNAIDAIASGHAELLFDRLAVLLGRNGVTYQHLRRIVVTAGPGSFTGVRIGLAAARGLGLALNIQVVGISSLAALSLSAPLGGPVRVLLDARRNEAYLQDFVRPGVPESQALLVPAGTADPRTDRGLVTGPYCDIARVARFGAELDPREFPPDAVYVRGADAKPQDAARVALAEVSA